MEYYSITTNITEHNSESAEKLFSILTNNIKDKSLINILKIDLSFIDFRATASDYIVINEVEHICDNTYSVHYTLDYYIYNLCKDMDIEGEHLTAMNFNVYDDHIEFDFIDIVRDTVNEF
ncbi:hypothetical protein [Enterobacter roggenkampii]|uniref:hypothetical protein n=1 Tax=Enterobacter roggenkampii TaxID=1812935 RepID=UPI0018F3F48A|nr:hypothetical protein [Enterobacter roggenkampii]